MSANATPPPVGKSFPERRYHRDRIRRARYAALADSEGFLQVCHAIEELGLWLRGTQGDLGKYWEDIGQLVGDPTGNFNGLYRIVKDARNDAMHTGAYARRATAKAVDLCLILEDSLMDPNTAPKLVGDYMVKEPVTVETWQPVARARQLMLTHSFSNLPVQFDDGWFLLTELGMAKYLLGTTKKEREAALGASIQTARGSLGLVKAPTSTLKAPVESLLAKRAGNKTTALWLVQDKTKRLLGVISAFELM